jgi:hypothetical protein
LPAAFHQADIHHSLGQLNGGAGESFTESFTIPTSVAASVYDIAAELSYTYEGQSFVRKNVGQITVVPAILTNSASFVPVEPGKAYVLRGWVKNSSTAGAVSLGVRQLKAGNGTISYTWQAAGLDTDWEQVELTFTAAPNAVSIGIYGLIDQTANDYAWIDDLELHEKQD